MSGRGVSFTVRLEGLHDIPVDAALHTALGIFKQMLEQQLRRRGHHFPSEQQVLILLDLSDPDRNHDTELRDDEVTLRQHGIRQGSVISLHLLGSAPALARAAQDVSSTSPSQQRQLQAAAAGEPTRLWTPVLPAQADHSYNGVIFDIASKGPNEVAILSLSAGGMLGHVKVLACKESWALGLHETESLRTYWGGSHFLPHEHLWEEVASCYYSPSWDRPQEIVFHTPVVIGPHARRGFYVHSSLPDDLGIQYQSYPRDHIIAEDDKIAIFPGVGHTGHQPFDCLHGWYRAFRGPAGGISYVARLKQWSIHTHESFPAAFKEALRAMLLCRNANGSSLNRLSTDVLLSIFEQCHYDWFDRPHPRRSASLPRWRQAFRGLLSAE